MSRDGGRDAAPPARQEGRPSSSGGRGRLTTVGALVEYREVLGAMVRRDLLVRYKQSVMGVAWALLVPLSSMVVFTIVFTRVVPLETGVPYPVFAYAGLLVWTWLASSVQFATTSLTANIALVTKLYFPRAVLPLSAVVVGLVDLLVASLLLAGLFVVYGLAIPPTIFLAPLLLAVQFALVYALALLAALGNLFFRDVRYLVGVLLPLWMWATPVVYPLDAADPALQRILVLNPATPIVEGWRAILFEGRFPDLGGLAFTAGAAALGLVVAWRLFHRLEPTFAELI